MKILGIETSCDETGICVLEVTGNIPNVNFNVLGDALYSQIAIHAQYGGVFPMMAKRAHSQNILHLTQKALTESNDWVVGETKISADMDKKIHDVLLREDNLAEELIKTISKINKPNIDVISVTHGPGLEPALWVGVNFARALSLIWNIPIVPSNHMLGHIYSVLLTPTGEMKGITFPIISLLISGGHTELVKITDWTKMEVIGRTRDDAVGEAFDKVARLLSLPYPGGPEISKLADEHRLNGVNENKWNLPKPMIHSDDLDFSFSGLKTAVLYAIKKHGDLSLDDKKTLAREFEDAVTEVLIHKTLKATDMTGAQTIIIGGGVSCNKNIRSAFIKAGEEKELEILLPAPKVSTDNAVMIALAGFINIQNGQKTITGEEDLRAYGNLKL
ncbi:MAG: tRNA (adenosine(37)-N6)-threonylcarbamoyltransferase complex transferase subunit TsaD [Minisyncoccia bacterium]